MFAVPNSIDPDLSLIFPRIALDLLAISYLVFGLFYRINKRNDLAVVYLACNIGLFSVLTVLSFSPLSTAVGFALFGVLSIIRLRSFEYTHAQIAYFFMSLSIALICAIDLSSLTLPALLLGMLLLVMTLVELKGFRERTNNMTITIDRVIIDESALKNHLSEILNAPIISCNIMEVNTLQETMLLQVVYRASQ
jgi:Domain of unknown function (DUF4956)